MPYIKWKYAKHSQDFKMHREINMVQGYVGAGRYTNSNSEPPKHASKYPILAEEDQDQQAKTENLVCF
jgi:hypothetical protein